MGEVNRNQEHLDDDGFLKEMSGWNRELAGDLADLNDLGPLNENHWKIIEYVRDYYLEFGEGPPIVKIAKVTSMTSDQICKLFPCGIARGAYRLAGLPRPSGCL
jgi:tRNA 2-thiouridine synthesizing protein E